MKVSFPIPNPNRLYEWAQQMIVVLQKAFNEVRPQLDTGVIIFWPEGIDPPTGGFLLCDGAEYPFESYRSLGRLLGESTPGNFEVPDVTAPANTDPYIKT